MNCYNIRLTLPDECHVKLALWDKEEGIEDEYLGVTEFDIEKR